MPGAEAQDPCSAARRGRQRHAPLQAERLSGLLRDGPLIEIQPEGIFYTHVHPEDCEEILEKTILHGEVIERLLYKLADTTYVKHDDIPFYKKQKRVVLETSGNTDAEDLDEYLAHDGYAALEKALFDMTPAEICAEVVDSGLRGRGGAGFPTGKKWESVRRMPAGKKYVVCNGDEGDPGAFMDRVHHGGQSPRDS